MTKKIIFSIGLKLSFVAGLCSAFYHIGAGQHRKGDSDSAVHAGAGGHQQRIGDGLANHPVSGGIGLSPQLIIGELLNTNGDNPISFVQGIAKLREFSCADVKSGWDYLLTCKPRQDHVPCLVSSWLWLKMRAQGETVEIPPGWGIENFSALAGLDDDGGIVLLGARLAAGDVLDSMERRLLFAQLIEEDPLSAVKLWTKHSTIIEHLPEIAWFAPAFSHNEKIREGLLDALLSWNKASQQSISESVIVSHLLSSWIHQDPVGVQQWLDSPSRGAYRDEILGEIATLSTVTDPIKAWEWSEKASPSARMAARVGSLIQFAATQPEKGALRIASTADANERSELTKVFSQHLAANDYDQWKTWLDSVKSPDEQVEAKVAAFDMWSARDIEPALNWLSSYNGGSKTRLVCQMALRNAAHDPTGVAQWIECMSDPEARLETAAAAIRGLPPGSTDSLRIILGSALGAKVQEGPTGF